MYLYLQAKDGKQYYSNCYIEGAVDYIFGNAAAWFGESTVASNGGGAITATSRELASQNTWYVFDHCNVSPRPTHYYQFSRKLIKITRLELQLV